MRRAEFLTLTALKADFFNALMRQRVIPVVPKSGSKAGWGDYSAELALLTNIALSLARSGVTQELASALVRSSFSEILKRAQSASEAKGEDFWFGYMVSTTEEYDSETQGIISSSVRISLEGTRSEIEQQLSDWRSTKANSPVSAVVLVSVTQQLQLLLERAERIGLKEETAHALVAAAEEAGHVED